MQVSPLSLSWWKRRRVWSLSFFVKVAKVESFVGFCLAVVVALCQLIFASIVVVVVVVLVLLIVVVVRSAAVVAVALHFSILFVVVGRKSCDVVVLLPARKLCNQMWDQPLSESDEEPLKQESDCHEYPAQERETVAAVAFPPLAADLQNLGQHLFLLRPVSRTGMKATLLPRQPASPQRQEELALTDLVVAYLWKLQQLMAWD